MLLRILSATGRSLLASRRAIRTPALKFSTDVGEIASKPIHYHTFGIAKVLVISAPFIYVGAYGAKSFAAYLEDFDLFVPDDDDD